MEIRGKIEAEFTLTPEESAAILQGMLNAGKQTSVIRTTPSKTQQPAPAPKPKNEPTPAPTPAATATSTPAATATAASTPVATATSTPAPAPEYKETPEQAVDYVKEQFNIPKQKRDRTSDEQKKAVALNKAIIALIRDITRNGSAMTLADIRDDLSRKEFIRRCMKLTYDVGGNRFEESVF